MERIVDFIIKNKCFVSVYVNEMNIDSFCFGKIIKRDKVFFIMEEISPKGKKDGLLLRRIDRIIKIEMQNQYEKDMLLLMEKENYNSNFYSFNSNNLLEELLQYAIDNRFIVKVLTYENDMIKGYPIEINSEYCKVMEIDEMGVELGIAYIPNREIFEIDCNSSDEMRLQLIYDLNN